MSAPLRRLPLLIATLSLCVASTAWAQANTDSKTAAKEHFARGTSYYDLGKYDDAIKEFEAAYQLKNDPAFLYNLAQSYRLAGNANGRCTFTRRTCARCRRRPSAQRLKQRIAALEKQVATESKTTTTRPPRARRPRPQARRHHPLARRRLPARRRPPVRRRPPAP